MFPLLTHITLNISSCRIWIPFSLGVGGVVWSGLLYLVIWN